MSVTELFDAYSSGKITRGAFIRRLAAFGMSVPVAAAYAGALARPSAARAEVGTGQPDLYPLYDMYDHPNLYDHPDLYDHPGN